MLRAIHARTYTVDDYEELSLMVDLADYYRCLPILSYSMDGALLKSPEVSIELEEFPDETFVLATKLRNATLFRDILIHIANPWSRPMYLAFLDPKLIKAGQRGYDSIAVKIAKAQHWMANKLAHIADPAYPSPPGLQF